MKSPGESYAHGELTRKIIASALQVHRNLGPGLLESTYRTCLARELESSGLDFRQEVSIPIDYKGVDISGAYRADVIVENSVLLELKAVDRLLPIHEAQILTYLKLSGLSVGLLMNFNVTRLRLGIRRLVR